MQLLVLAHCTPGASLRERIARDPKVAKYGLVVQKELTPGRNPGWMKMQSADRRHPGAINIEWDADANLLTCRIITRFRNPTQVAGALVSYLLARHRRRVRNLLIVP